MVMSSTGVQGKGNTLNYLPEWLSYSKGIKEDAPNVDYCL